ncbi:sulfurtransferase complex subunit TusC [Buchnera aphidicola]|uniref:Sulfurtransferase complex subunit TusC n=1 Tax=Buchnera aphidicola subsp. Uroleucon sonchi TaxID=118118 RepID=A0A6C1FCE9_BUCUN|nr:sulfurtransferase complex subunit TusC [Buchnera aphidicola]QIE02207.1 sulfurtransferase complex subunit TusC [Buchnera aphidicola (Uroleucon sonchi)]
MNKIAFIFSHSPHGTSLGREGLDSIFGLSSVFQKISVFFINDGVLQLIKNYKSTNILSRDYTPAFSILSMYDIKEFYCCKSSLKNRGLHNYTRFILNITILDAYLLRLKLDNVDLIINF